MYVEYERTSEASRIQKEIVGDGPLHFEPIGELRRETENEIEAKLIVSSAVRSWNLSENFILEKNLDHQEYEFGYALGASRALSNVATGSDCLFCAERFVAGVEAYGGLGSTEGFGVKGARHYVAPVLLWHVSDRSSVKASAAFGLTEASDRVLFRIG